jgi:hypothetical protein
VGFEELKIQGVGRRGMRVGFGRRLGSAIAANPSGERLPFGVILRSPEFSTSVPCIAARFGRQGMEQQAALRRIAGNHQLRDCLKIETRLFFGPCRISRRQGNEPKTRGQRGMTVVATNTVLPLLEKDWLNASAVGRKVYRRLSLRWGSGCPRPGETRPSYRRDDQTSENRRSLV